MFAVDSPDAAPDFAEPFEAWRVWRVAKCGFGTALASVMKGVVWPAEEPLAAECLTSRSRLSSLLRIQPHEAPMVDCHCGIYAADLERVSQYLMFPSPFELGTVLGRVALWGDVIECERGYRATFAYPVSLYVPVDQRRGGRQRADEIAEGLGCYGVPVELLPREPTSPLRSIGCRPRT